MNDFAKGFLSGIMQANNMKSIFLILLVAGVVFAQTEFGMRFYNLLDMLCGTMVMLLPVVALSLLVLAAVVYGIGHVFGSETKSKAQSWATGMIIGMIISLVIWLLAKPMITILLGEEQMQQLPEDFCTPKWE